jgi:hypothetical protein
MSLKKDIRLFSYKLTNDSGFAPNPFWGFLTLATCKPQIRLRKKEGDWIAGFTSGELCQHAVGRERLIYLMRVKEKMPIARYFRDARFARKIPKPMSTRAIERVGDNIYEPRREPATAPSDFRQLKNEHHFDDMNRRCAGVGESQVTDLSGLNVLIAQRYAYFGSQALYIPDGLRPEVPRGQSAHGVRTADNARAQAFIEYVFARAGRKCVIAQPLKWPQGDDSWRSSE